MSPDADLAVGVALPEFHARLTRSDLVRYAGASTDFNPIHYSDHAAAALGLPGVIAHGLLTMGVALRAVTEWIGDPQRVRGYSAHFARPVVVPDDDAGVTLVVTGSVASQTDDTALIDLNVTCDEVAVLTRVVVEVAR
ncbi:MAG: dehydratase [Propionibacteriaceae bacterium]|jgi:acyl dehydratase|nr:dehydratase [Propionibacteriaceae bacterium]